MTENHDDLCPRPSRLREPATRPHALPIYLASVYECSDPEQADALLSGAEQGHDHQCCGIAVDATRKGHGLSLSGEKRRDPAGQGPVAGLRTL